MRWAIGHLLTAVSKSSGNGAHPGAPCIRPSCDPGSGLIYWGPGRATLLVCRLHGLRAVPDTMGGMKFSHWVGAGGGAPEATFSGEMLPFFPAGTQRSLRRGRLERGLDERAGPTGFRKTGA